MQTSYESPEKWLTIMRPMRYLLCAVFCVALTGPALGQSTYCSSSQAGLAAKIIYTVGSWNALYQYYMKYAYCDSETAAIGYSDRAGDLMANQWDAYFTVVPGLSKSELFLKYTLPYLNDMVPVPHMKKILDNAEKHCPQDQTETCTLIALRVRRVLQITD